MYTEAVLVRLRQGAVRLLRLNASPHGIALGFTLGLGLSLVPIPFLGMIVALALAPIVGASLPAVYAGTAVVNPVTGAAIYFAELWVGSLVLGNPLPSWSELRGLEWREWLALFGAMIPTFLAGAATSMTAATLVCYPSLRWLVARYGGPRDQSASEQDQGASSSAGNPMT